MCYGMNSRPRERTPCKGPSCAGGAPSGRKRGVPPAILATGDEGQIVIPSDFEWSTFSDLLTRPGKKPERFNLTGNVRSPQPLVEIINNSWELCATLSKAERPRGYARAGFAEATSNRGAILSKSRSVQACEDGRPYSTHGAAAAASLTEEVDGLASTFWSSEARPRKQVT